MRLIPPVSPKQYHQTVTDPVTPERIFSKKPIGIGFVYAFPESVMAREFTGQGPLTNRNIYLVGRLRLQSGQKNWDTPRLKRRNIQDFTFLLFPEALFLRDGKSSPGIDDWLHVRGPLG